MHLSRRATLLGGAVLAAGCAAPEAPATTPASTPAPGTGTPSPPPGERHDYGPGPDQYGVLRLPESGSPRATVVLLHGGFWQEDFKLDLMDDLAVALTARGHATWNLEYRRVGAGGGWPTTFEDVAAGIDHLEPLRGTTPIGDRTVLLGHSAGGHLAAWAASRTAATPGGAPASRVHATVPLSGVLAATRAYADSVGRDALPSLFGGSPAEHPERYRLGDPLRLVPAQGRVIAAHGVRDDLVPLDQSRRYVAAARAAGGRARLVELDCGHFEGLDPRGHPGKQVLDLVDAVLGGGRERPAGAD